MRRMADSVTPENCPNGFDLYAGYVNGSYPSYWKLAQLHPGKVVSITVTASGRAQVLDVERGNASPAEVPAWVQWMRSVGREPTVYANLSTWPAVKAACSGAGLVTLPYWWAAGYHDPPTPYLPPGAVACQWIDHGPYDESLVVDFWPGIDSPTERFPWWAYS